MHHPANLDERHFCDAAPINQRSSDQVPTPRSIVEPDAMDALRAALGVSSDAGVGDAVQASLGDAGTLDGAIDYSTPEFLGVRTADGLYRFFGRNHFGSVVGMSAHLFVDGVDAAAREAQLKAWLDGVYATEQSRVEPS